VAHLPCSTGGYLRHAALTFLFCIAINGAEESIACSENALARQDEHSLATSENHSQMVYTQFDEDVSRKTQTSHNKVGLLYKMGLSLCYSVSCPSELILTEQDKVIRNREAAPQDFFCGPSSKRVHAWCEHQCMIDWFSPP
jgi:hypothetical protein